MKSPLPGILLLLSGAAMGATPMPMTTTAVGGPADLAVAPAVSATLTAPVIAPVTAPAPAPAAAVIPLPSPIVFTGLIQVWEVMPQAVGQVPTTRFHSIEFQARGEVGDHASWWLKLDPAQVRENDVKTAKFSVTPAGTVTSAVTSVGRKSILQDAVVAYDRPFPEAEWVKRIQVGQFKPPFGMEGLTPTSDIDTAERSMMSTVLKWSNQRDLGGMVNLGAGRFDLWAGGFNGEGQNTDDVNNYENMNFRASWRVASWIVVGGAWQGGRTGLAKDLNDHAGAELSCKWHLGAVPLTLKSEFAYGASGPRGRAVNGRTAYGRVGVGIWPDVLELVGKEDWIDPSLIAAADWRTETTAGLNWFLHGRQAEVQFNYIREDEPATPGYPKIANDLMRVNVQASF